MSEKNTLKPIAIGDRMLGSGHPAFIVAEIGINHNGDMQLAKECIAAAAETGADSVKFQNFKADDFVNAGDDERLMFKHWQMRTDGTLEEVEVHQYEMFKKVELSYDQLAELKDYCDQCGVVFHSTPTSREGIEDLVKLGAPLLKNGSDFLLNVELIRTMGETGLPTVISVGMATEDQIEDAVQAFRATGNDQLIILQCTSIYPLPADQVNLAKIPAISEQFDCLAGFSDHTQGAIAAIGSVHYGACFIEKHFTLDKTLLGPDHWFSCDPAELKQLVDGVRAAEKNIGSPVIEPAEQEWENKKSYQISCAANDDFPAGHVLTESDIIFQRPGTGIPPKDKATLVGKALKESVQKGQVFKTALFG